MKTNKNNNLDTQEDWNLKSFSLCFLDVLIKITIFWLTFFNFYNLLMSTSNIIFRGLLGFGAAIFFPFLFYLFAVHDFFKY